MGLPGYLAFKVNAASFCASAPRAASSTRALAKPLVRTATYAAGFGRACNPARGAPHRGRAGCHFSRSARRRKPTRILFFPTLHDRLLDTEIGHRDQIDGRRRGGRVEPAAQG